MRKSEELLKDIENIRKELTNLVDEDFRIFEILQQLEYFHIDTEPDSKGMIGIYYGYGQFPMGGRFQEDEMLYALIILNFYCDFYYKCKKVIRRIRKRTYSEKINSSLHTLGMTIRKQALNDIKINEKFRTKHFCKAFKNFIHVATRALGHKYDQIGYKHLTDTFDAEEALELEHIRKIYEKISFKDNTITYFDYITKTFKTFGINDTVEMQYMFMNLYTKAYMESVLWLKKEDSSGQWCPMTPWQLIRKLKMMISQYFLY